MNIDNLLKRALAFEFLSIEEGVYLFKNAPTADLMFVANELPHQYQQLHIIVDLYQQGQQDK
mgnify:CR=1 FL=1